MARPGLGEGTAWQMPLAAKRQQVLLFELAHDLVLGTVSRSCGLGCLTAAATSTAAAHVSGAAFLAAGFFAPQRHGRIAGAMNAARHKHGSRALCKHREVLLGGEAGASSRHVSVHGCVPVGAAAASAARQTAIDTAMCIKRPGSMLMQRCSMRVRHCSRRCVRGIRAVAAAAACRRHFAGLARLEVCGVVSIARFLRCHLRQARPQRCSGISTAAQRASDRARGVRAAVVVLALAQRRHEWRPAARGAGATAAAPLTQPRRGPPQRLFLLCRLLSGRLKLRQ
eukprot:358080-Chlamydomonas_euryale.AAC.4